jgi:exodeoxyribonuclease V alpha subunit
MHLRNNYTKDVFNGDSGTVFQIDSEDQKMVIEYDGRRISYDFSELEEISLAYAITVHKSQGSEYPAVIIPLVTQHHPMLQRNLLYTAMTRGKQLVVLIGQSKALAIALGNDRSRRRLSTLSERLRYGTADRSSILDIAG